MPASDSTEALRHPLAKVLCAISVSVDDCTAMRKHAVATPRANYSSAAIAESISNSGGGTRSLATNNNPPQQWVVQPVADKVYELIKFPQTFQHFPCAAKAR